MFYVVIDIIGVNLHKLIQQVVDEFIFTHFKKNDKIIGGRLTFNINDNDIDELLAFMKKYIHEYFSGYEHESYGIKAQYYTDKGVTIRIYEIEHRGVTTIQAITTFEKREEF